MDKLTNLRIEIADQAGIAPDDLKDLTETELQEFRNINIKLKQQAASLESLKKEPGHENRSTILTVESHLARLDQLADHEVSSIDTEEYRNHQNLVTYHKNKIRESYGLEPLPVETTDKQLLTLLQLDGYDVGINCKDFLSVQKDKGTQKDLEKRIKALAIEVQLKATALEKEEEVKTKILALFKRVTTNRPPSYLSDETSGRMIVNEKFESWKSDLKTLRQLVNGKVKAAESLELVNPDRYKIDKRAYFWKIKDEVDEILSSLDQI